MFLDERPKVNKSALHFKLTDIMYMDDRGGDILLVFLFFVFFVTT